jgi:ATP-dependent protease Clp ATPase subunit
MNEEKTRQIITAHKQRVMLYMMQIASDILKRAIEHDDSKFSEEEFPFYAQVAEEFEKHPFGSDGYNKAKESVSGAVSHHYEHNRHHPEHFKYGIDDMSLVDLIEMLCDWKSATLNHPEAPGDMMKSLELATRKYNISPQLMDILSNTITGYKLE